MPEFSEHEPSRSVVFQAAPAVRTDAPRPLSRLTGAVVSVMFALTVAGVLVLGGSAFWTVFEPPDRTPTPLWLEAPQPGTQGTHLVEDRPSTPPRQEPIAGTTIRHEDDSSDFGSGGGGDVSSGSGSGASSGSSGSNSGPGSGSGDDSSGSNSGPGSGSDVDSSGSNSGPGSGSGDDSSGSNSGSGSSGSNSGSGSGGGDSSGSGSGD